MFAAYNGAHGVARYAGVAGDLPDAFALSVQDVDLHLKLLRQHREHMFASAWVGQFSTGGLGQFYSGANNCILKDAKLGDLHAQRSDISGTLNTESFTLKGDFDIVGLHAFAWISNGANISGAISAESTDIANINLQNSRVSGDALFETSNITRGINLTGAVLKGINFNGATVSILQMTSVKISGVCQLGLVRAGVIMAVDASIGGDVFLHDSTLANQVNLSGAQVSGAVYLDRLRVGGSVEMRVSPLGAAFRSGGTVTACGAEVGGQFVAASANIGGDLLIASMVCSDIILEGSIIGGSVKGDAARVTGSLKADRIAIQEGMLSVARASFGGGISFNDAAVGGDVSLNSAIVQTFAVFERTQIAGGFSAIHARIDGPLYFQRASIAGAIDLTQSTVSEIVFQASFSDGWNDDVVKFGSVVLKGTTYDRLRVGWKPFGAYLAKTLDANEDAIYELEGYLRRTARIAESEKVYLLRRRAEARRLRGISRLGASLIDWVTGFGVAKARLIFVCFGVLAALVAMCALVPNFVVEDKGQCRGVVAVDFQEALVVASKVFAPPEKDAKFRISDCPVVWNVRASTVVLFIQVVAAILLPVLLGTVTGLFRSQSRMNVD